jgi:hypothetical protein
MFGRRRQLNTLVRACDLLHRDASVTAPEVVKLGSAIVLRVRLNYNSYRVVQMQAGRWITFDVFVDKRTGDPLTDDLHKMAGLAGAGPLPVLQRWDAHEVASAVISELVAYWDAMTEADVDDRERQYAAKARATIHLDHE